MSTVQSTTDAPVVDAKKLSRLLDALELVDLIAVLVKQNNIRTFGVSSAVALVIAGTDFLV